MRTGSSNAFNNDFAPASARRILIIDDNKFRQTMIHGYLRFEDSPMVVDVATSAQDALALVEHGERYDLIIAEYLLEVRSYAQELLQVMKESDSATFVLTSNHDMAVDTFDVANGMRYVSQKHLRTTLKEILAEKSGSPTVPKAKWSGIVQSQFQFLIFATIMAASALYMASLVARNGLPK